MHYLLFYEAADDYVTKRTPFREDHLRKGWEASERGELILGGAFANPTDGAVLLFQGDSPEVAERFARADPYVINGAVRRWYVREWNTVVGPIAANPLRPPGSAQPVEATSSGARTSDHDVCPSASTGMILRMWRAKSDPVRADAYIEHAKQRVFPLLHKSGGYRGAYILRRILDATAEVVVVTFWESMAAVRQFAGAHPEKAVVEPEAKAVLLDFDRVVSHFEIVETHVR
jgi:uncharacterized protein YciI/heme-degrading monooxygenase HmoA